MNKNHPLMQMDRHAKRTGKPFETEAKTSCIGCRHCSAGRWSGWSCRLGVPGDDDDDYSCYEPDTDREFWRQYMKTFHAKNSQEAGS